MLEQASGWGKHNTVGGVNADGGGDASEDTKEEWFGRDTIDTEEGPRGEDGPRGDVIHREEGPGGDRASQAVN